MSTDDAPLRSRNTQRVSMERITFRVPNDQYEDIEAVVDNGEYPSRSEFVREAVRDKLNGGDDR